jgi:2-C-methyl-D-erythritol 2,4-cyclodiphosphate synthase
VLVHAVIDAVLGAAALGDIGRIFPDNDPVYKNISSIFLLEKVNSLLKESRQDIINIDSVIIAETPKLADFIPQMEGNIAGALGIETGRVSVKAKTNEKMGFVGRSEGMAAQAVCLIADIGNR